LWQESKKLELELNADENEAWIQFRRKIYGEQATARLVPLPAKRKNKCWMQAAVITVLLIGSILALLLNRKNNPVTELVQVQALDSVFTAALPDGSKVTLKKQSGLVHNKTFTGNTREVVLTGEAFFSVTHNVSQPFIVKVKDITITVLGSSFNVKATTKGVEIVVEAGRVEVARKEKKLVLQAKEKTMVTDTAAAFSKTGVTNKLYQRYCTRELVCDNTSLWQLVEALNEIYNANIVIENNAIRNLPLSNTFY
jgi:ferric-dicitrate binding protein FerR (iron transport regulator)